MIVSGNYQVVLDTCVLAPPNLCDLLLRLAETPRLYLPRWSDSILEEVKRTQISVFKFDEQLAEYWRSEVALAFPEARVTQYEPYIPKCTNHKKDRHVLAVAIRSQCSDIVTSNLKDFSREALDPWGVKAVSPSSFLTSLYEMKPVIVASKIDDMASHKGVSREQILRILYRSVPAFANRMAAELEIDITAPLTPAD